MQKRNKPLFKRWWFRIAAFFLIWIIIHAIVISIQGLNDNYTKADVAIILGNRVYEDGSLSTWLQGRVDKALKLYREGKVKIIFASGGISTKENGGYPEGDAMKHYLVQHGVPDSVIVSDNYGQNTYLTAKNFIKWNKQYHFNSVIVVSQFYHITRTQYILKKLGFKNVTHAASEEFEWKDIESIFREVPAFYKYMVVY